MRGQKRLSPSEQILRFVEQQRDLANLEMQLAVSEQRDITSAAWGAWNALDMTAQYIKSLLRNR